MRFDEIITENIFPEVLYHGTCVEFFIRMIEENSMRAFKVDNGPVGVSCTRDYATAHAFQARAISTLIRRGKSFIPNAHGSMLIGVVITLNGTKLQEAGYGIVPYASRLNRKESEVRIDRDIKPLNEFISHVEFRPLHWSVGPLAANHPDEVSVEQVAQAMIAAGERKAEWSKPVRHDWSTLTPSGNGWIKMAQILLSNFSS